MPEPGTYRLPVRDARLVDRHGGHHGEMPPGLDRIFPTPAQLAEAPLEQLGLPRARAATLRVASGRRAITYAIG